MAFEAYHPLVSFIRFEMGSASDFGGPSSIHYGRDPFQSTVGDGAQCETPADCGRSRQGFGYRPPTSGAILAASLIPSFAAWMIPLARVPGRNVSVVLFGNAAMQLLLPHPHRHYFSFGLSVAHQFGRAVRHRVRSGQQHAIGAVDISARDRPPLMPY